MSNAGIKLIERKQTIEVEYKGFTILLYRHMVNVQTNESGNEAEIERIVVEFLKNYVVGRAMKRGSNFKRGRDGKIYKIERKTIY